jgi:CelD/BcsL family acetyltransferase involved in cellulose biosynthesis
MDVAQVTDADLSDELVGEWEALVDVAGVPACSGALLRAWYRHRCPPDAEPRVWLVRDAGRLIGVLPLVAVPLRGGTQLLPAGSGAIYGVGPVTASGQEAAVATAMAEAMAGSGDAIDLVRVDGLPAGSRWPTAMSSVLGPAGLEGVVGVGAWRRRGSWSGASTRHPP